MRGTPRSRALAAIKGVKVDFLLDWLKVRQTDVKTIYVKKKSLLSR